MQIGAFVVTPLWNSGRMYEKVAVAIVTDVYEYLDHDPEPTPRQTRSVIWLRKDLDREALLEETKDYCIAIHADLFMTRVSCATFSCVRSPPVMRYNPAANAYRRIS